MAGVYKSVSADPGAYVHNSRYAPRLLHGSRNDPGDTMDSPGKADFFG